MFLISELLDQLGISYKLLTNIPESDISFICSANTIPESGAGDLCIYYPADLFCELWESRCLTIHAGTVILVVDKNAAHRHQVENASTELPSVTFYYVPDTEESQVLLSRLQSLLNNERRRIEQLVSVEYRALVNLLERGVDISKIEAFAYRLLDNPMIILDESFKVLAYTKSVRVDDPLWLEIVTNTYTPLELQEKGKANNFLEQLERSSQAFFMDDKGFEGLIRRAIATIRVGSEVKGCIVLLEVQRRINRLDLYVMQMLAEIISAKMNETDAILQATGQLRGEFSSDLLTGNFTSVKMIESRARSLGLRFGEWTCVLGVQAEDESLYIGPELDRLRVSLHSHCNLCIYTFNGRQSYFILSFSNRQKWRCLISKTLEAFLARRKLVGILSLPTGELTELPRCYGQVQRLFHLLPKLLEPGRVLYAYSSLAPLDLIDRMFSDTIEPILSEAYHILLKTDRQEGTEYIPTLRSFFASNQSVSETAKRLFIHRNTVNYRLNRIRGLLEDDFDNPLIRLYIQLSILADDLN